MSAKALSKIYHNFKYPGSLGGVKRLLKRVKQLYVPGDSRQTIQEYLRREQAYTLHKPARSRLTRNNIYVSGIGPQSQTDLADMQGTA